MAKIKQPINPFYALLVIAGVAFCITACAYGVMMLKTTRPAGANVAAPADSESGKHLIEWMEDHGMTTMLVELGVLAVATVGAIWLDNHRAAQAANENSQFPENVHG